MKILHVTDLHYHLPHYHWLESVSPQYELVIISGDLLDSFHPHPRPLQWSRVLPFLLRTSDCTRLAFCSGNHDVVPSESFLESDQLRLMSSVVADDQTKHFADCTVTSIGWETIYHGELDRIEDGLRQLPARKNSRPWIMVCHQPPRPREERRDFLSPAWTAATLITGSQPTIYCCGHIHEADPVFERIGHCFISNPGRYETPPLPLEPAHVVIDLHSGEATWRGDGMEFTVPLLSGH